jgi:hypothetical protein
LLVPSPAALVVLVAAMELNFKTHQTTVLIKKLIVLHALLSALREPALTGPVVLPVMLMLLLTVCVGRVLREHLKMDLVSIVLPVMVERPSSLRQVSQTAPRVYLHARLAKALMALTGLPVLLMLTMCAETALVVSPQMGWDSSVLTSMNAILTRARTMVPARR